MEQTNENAQDLNPELGLAMTRAKELASQYAGVKRNHAEIEGTSDEAQVTTVQEQTAERYESEETLQTENTNGQEAEGNAATNEETTVVGTEGASDGAEAHQSKRFHADPEETTTAYNVVSQEISMTSPEAGSLIGKGGETIRRIHAESGAKLTVSEMGTKDSARTVTISGSSESVKKASEIVKSVIENNGYMPIQPVVQPSVSASMGTSSMASMYGNYTQQHQAHGYTPHSASGSAVTINPTPTNGSGYSMGAPTDTMLIPYRKVGFVIGKSGERIKDFIAKSGCHIQVSQAQDRNDTTSDRSLNFSGAPAAVATAKKLITEFLQNSDMARGGTSASGSGGSGGNDQGATGPVNVFESNLNKTLQEMFAVSHNGIYPQTYVQDSIVVLGRYMGVVIGMGGANIKSLQTDYNVHLQLGPDSDTTTPNNNDKDPNRERLLYLYGEPSNIANIKSKLTQLLEGVALNPRNSTHLGGNRTGGGSGLVTIVVPVPSDKVGAIIGRGGEKFKWLMSTTNTRIKFENTLNPATNTKDFRIEGTPEQVSNAQAIIAQKLAEIESQSPGGMGGMGGMGPRGGNGAGSMNYQQGASAPGTHGYMNTMATGQYYNGQQQPQVATYNPMMQQPQSAYPMQTAYNPAAYPGYTQAPQDYQQQAPSTTAYMDPQQMAAWANMYAQYQQPNAAYLTHDQQNQNQTQSAPPSNDH